MAGIRELEVRLFPVHPAVRNGPTVPAAGEEFAFESSGNDNGRRDIFLIFAAGIRSMNV